MTADKTVYLSVVIPMFNEESNVQKLVQSLKGVIDPMKLNYEIILVDDGSKDDTWQRIAELNESDKRIRGVKLARNFGHQHALLAGLHKARGQAVVSMDGDLQHPPETIPELVAKHQEGYQVVNTCRDDVEVASFFKRKSSSTFYSVFSYLTDVKMCPGSSDFRLLDRLALDHLLALKGVDVFLRGAVSWLGFHSTTVPYVAGKRFSGESKYTLSKMVNFARNSIISFSIKPLTLGIWLGAMTSLLAFMEIIYILLQTFMGNTVPGWASTVGIISFLFGILFIILGIIGSYLARIHIALQNRPAFIISELHDD